MKSGTATSLPIAKRGCTFIVPLLQLFNTILYSTAVKKGYGLSKK